MGQHPTLTIVNATEQRIQTKARRAHKILNHITAHTIHFHKIMFPLSALQTHLTALRQTAQQQKAEGAKCRKCNE